jgi:hypothetical protein
VIFKYLTRNDKLSNLARDNAAETTAIRAGIWLTLGAIAADLG